MKKSEEFQVHQQKDIEIKDTFSIQAYPALSHHPPVLGLVPLPSPGGNAESELRYPGLVNIQKAIENDLMK